MQNKFCICYACYLYLYNEHLVITIIGNYVLFG